MVEHLVFFHKRPDVTPELEQRFIAGLRGLKGKVPGIIELSCGLNITPARGQGYELAVRVLLQDRAALEGYGPHPEHEKVKVLVPQYADNVIVVDYER